MPDKSSVIRASSVTVALDEATSTWLGEIPKEIRFGASVSCPPVPGVAVADIVGVADCATVWVGVAVTATGVAGEAGIVQVVRDGDE